MATTKKAAAAALTILDLTKPKFDDKGKLLIEGLEATALELFETQAHIDELLEEQKQRRGFFEPKMLENYARSCGLSLNLPTFEEWHAEWRSARYASRSQ